MRFIVAAPFTMAVLLVAAVAAALVYFFFFRTRGGGSAPTLGEDSANREQSSANRASSQSSKNSTKGHSASSSSAEGGSSTKSDSTKSDSTKAGSPALTEVENRTEIDITDAVSALSEAPASDREPPPPPSRGPNVKTLRHGLARSRDSAGLFGRLKELFGSNRELDSGLLDEIEEVLLTSDVGVATADKLLSRIRATLQGNKAPESAEVWDALRAEALSMVSLDGAQAAIRLGSKPTVALFVGVNGAGKTTTIGKLATQLTASGHTCVLAAGDTFRAAAVQQLKIWGKRVGCEVVYGKDGADPGSVLFDAVKKAQELGADIVLADTAGRLHTKSNLMNEMQKIERSAGKALSGAPHEIFLVLDATNGQNAVAQAREFKNTLNLTGIVLTKLDGTAKGGVVLGICDSLEVPVRYVGLGEGPDDLHEFHAARFVDALLGDE